MDKSSSNIFSELGIISLNTLASIEASYNLCSFGCPIFDTFMKGGLRPGLLTEICGEAGAGKSQLALQIMLYTLLNKNKNEIVNSCFYISTQKPLSDTRLNQLKQAFFSKNKIKNPDDLEKKLMLKHATNLNDFSNDLSTLQNKLEDGNKDKIRLVVIDTIAGICSEFIANNNKGLSGVDTQERRNFLIKISNTLKKFAAKHNLAILILNNMSSAFNEDNEIYKKEKLVPALGLLWSNLLHERYQLKKRKNIVSHNMTDKDLIKEKVKRIFKVKFSSRFQKKKMDFIIENDGVFGTYSPAN